MRYIEAAEQLTIALTAAIEEALGVPPGRLQDQLGLTSKDSAFAAIRDLAKKQEASDAPLSPEEVLAALPKEMPYERMKIVRYGSEGNEQGVGAHRDGGWVSTNVRTRTPSISEQPLI